MKKFLFAFLVFQKICFASIDFSIFERYQEKLTRSEIEERLEIFLQKDEKLKNYFSLNEEAFVLYNSSEMQEGCQVEYRLKLLRNKKKKPPQSSSRNLEGIKVAIDPGHLGGEYAYLEERYIDIPPSLDRKVGVQFDEGSLSYLTAMHLKALLEKEGANVLVTRERIGKGVFPENFFDWLKKNPPLWSTELTLSQIFKKYYNPLDLRARADKINGFSPDLTVVIHYNSHGSSEKNFSNHCVTPQNYNLVFIPGAFCKDELAQQDSRYEFLRLLLSEDLTKSLHLSRAILEKFCTHLNVSTISNGDGARYLETVCKKVEEGIYARNLALTRLIHGPVCYGETLIQNNIDECLNLNRKDFIIENIRCSSRIKQVAEAYFEGIKSYLQKKDF